MAKAKRTRDTEIYDSDAIDDSEPESKPTKKKQKSTRRKKQQDGSDSDGGIELREGQTIVGKVVQAPTTGRVPPGQISQNTLDFLTKLKDPKCNDREWFKLHEPVYRLAEKEWQHFIEKLTELVIEVDPQIPPLPPKDLIHRIYRDIRLAMTRHPTKPDYPPVSREAVEKASLLVISLKPGGESLFAAGTWCPGRNELSTIRSNILRNPSRLRTTISSPAFTKLFGDAKPKPDGGRRNIFGNEDELKVAPKGVAKDHPDIDLLKCRSLAVVCHFKDDLVLKPDFNETLAEVFKVAQPFVHCLNDMMTIAPGDNDDDEDEEEEEEEGEGEDDEDED